MTAARLAPASAMVARAGTLDSALRSSSGRPLTDLVNLAVRRNPRRAHLLVSSVLGKHVPAEPHRVLGAATELGRLVNAAIGGAPALVLGYAETATALGHGVAAELAAPYLHSTRRPVPGVTAAGGFEEAHSHATDHSLLPTDPALLGHGEVLVLVDDEISTGRTARNTIALLHARWPRARYVLAALVDVRAAEERTALAAFAAGLGVTLDVIALATGELRLPPDLAELARPAPADPPSAARGMVPNAVVPWPVGVRESGRHGFTPSDEAALRAACLAVAGQLDPSGPRVLVLGTEELMYPAFLIAAGLAGRSGLTVRTSSTTRSPVVALDVPGYPIRTALTFPAHDRPADGPGPRFAYNVLAPAGAEPFSEIVLILDAATRAADRRGLTDALRVAADSVTVVTLPMAVPC